MSAETYGVEQLLRDLRDDTCPVHGCEASLSSGSLLCRGHWRLLPADLKREVYESVRRVDRLSRAYDRASGHSGVIDHVNPSPREAKLATEWLEAEQVLRDVQLRAVIVASERAGARPDVVGSAPSTTPRKGGCMRIKVCRIEDGPARVEVLTAEGETVQCVDVNAGEEVEVSIANTPDAPPTVGEVCETPPQGDAGTGGESETAGDGAGDGSTAGEGDAGAGEAGDGAASGEGEGSASGVDAPA